MSEARSELPRVSKERFSEIFNFIDDANDKGNHNLSIQVTHELVLMLLELQEFRGNFHPTQTSLQQRLSRYEETLKVYADEKNWGRSDEVIDISKTCLSKVSDLWVGANHGYTIAQSALEEPKEGK